MVHATKLNRSVQNLTNPQIHYPLGDALPPLGEAREVVPGVRWIRMRLPFALDHINLWLLRDEIDGVEGWTIIDCGICNAETQTAWETIFATQLANLPVLRVIVTHMHPDHVGLAKWLCERWQAPLWMSMAEYLTAQWLSNKEGAQQLAPKWEEGDRPITWSAMGLIPPKTWL